MVVKRKVIWTFPAKNDLQTIYNYFADISPTIAAKQINRIIRKIDILEAGFTHIGQIEPLLINRAKEYRYLVQDNYKIIYFTENDKVVISTIFDTRQYPQRLKKKIK